MKTIAASIVLLQLLLTACPASEETRIRQALEAMQEAVVQKNAGKFVSYLADDFEDQQGRDARAVRGYVAGLLLRNSRVGVYIGLPEIKINADHARTECTVTVTGADGLIPERMRRVVLLLDWVKVSGDWRVFRANWHEPGE
ncbi:MAG: nuclear transport factor 2 family protein [Gammaproteobacteria bacterium]|nr:nuclear transport factor 2 family protein [Gammaproteobacteria bacterium]